jgi:ComF family protein
MADTLSRIVYGAKEWLDAGLAFIYPEVCDLCGSQRATPAQGYVCQRCREQVGFIEPPLCQHCGRPYEGEITVDFVCSDCRGADYSFVSARSAAVARGPVLEAVHGYKYDGKLWFESFLAELLVSRAIPELRADEWDVVVPVPLHATKQRERGFNQSEQLGRWLAKAMGLPLRTNIVRRVVATRTQTRLNRDERQANVRDAFAVICRVQGARVILLDDVFTTGATTNACARALRQAGASTVCVWTVARGI